MLYKCLIHSFIHSFILRQINEVIFHLQLLARYRILPVFHVSLLKPVFPSALGPNEPTVPPPPEVMAEPSIYCVQNILDSQWWGGHLEYLIDWEGKPRSPDTNPLIIDHHHHLSQLIKSYILALHCLVSNSPC